MEKEPLFGKTLNELIEVTKRIRLPGYSARQIADWLYKHKIYSIDEMTNLSKKAREMLSSEYTYGLSSPAGITESMDGTKKYLYKVLNEKYIETACIPEKNRTSLCVSTQAGCKMGCRFCMTGKQGFQGNLSSHDILNQFRSLPEYEKVTNIVYMGMGEPLDNIEEVLKSLDILTSDWGYAWSPTRITVSTVGIIKAIKLFLERSRVHLAVSLHTPFENERLMLMPVQKTNPLKDIIEIIKKAGIKGQRRISFEYILFRGLNDSPGHIKELARLLGGIRCRVNLIRFHKIPGLKYESPGPEEIIKFRNRLNKKGITATIRASRGEDIGAACGLLSTLTINNPQK
ncbi:MAG: 23S rRNA (adenine(2503)-C(2))-methyltransferase RlmN [Bacteroidales bacterium]